jgi:(p)ppGpp synthase/HD superfamily hydrolase
MAVPMFSTSLDRALALAALVHRAQTRQGTRLPSLMHPAHVAMLLTKYGYGEPLTVAGILHDVLEDVDLGDQTLVEDIDASFRGLAILAGAADRREAFRRFADRLFGHDVMRLVNAVTECKFEGDTERPWIERRIDILDHLTRMKRDEAVLKAADALHNVCSIVEDASLGRASLTARLKATPEETLWYYREVGRRVRARAEGEAIVEDLEQAIARLGEFLSPQGR